MERLYFIVPKNLACSKGFLYLRKIMWLSLCHDDVKKRERKNIIYSVFFLNHHTY